MPNRYPRSSRSRHCSWTLPLPALLLFLVSCGDGPQGLRLTEAGDGPVVVVDWDAEPLPELPFPNDLAARPDPSSPTGLRLNFSEDAPTLMERETRAKVNRLTGFGIYSPISIRFSEPLDLDNIAQRHANDLDPSDDAVYVIDVTPTSPTFRTLVELDVGHGRYPADVVQTDRYFPNDARSESPSALFETYDEDLDGDGELDWGEDTDNDGVLDVPNVYPVGGDPREDLLSWYERETDTLILRPVVPLREETTYAVVITSRLVGEDGNRVVSPWTYVNHTRQTDALWPIQDVLPERGLSLEDVDFAWVYTTGRVTGDLVDIRRGFDGEGPFGFLQTEYPPGVSSAQPMHEIGGIDNVYALPVDEIVEILTLAGLLPEASEEVIGPGLALTSHLVGGTFSTTNLLVDKDDAGRDTSDEWWVLDAATGEMVHEPLEVTFTCGVPVADEAFPQPFPVVFYGHGYGSSRLEFLMMTWAAARVGIATCGMDYPAHGIDLGGSEIEDYGELLELSGLLPFIEHLGNNRARDLDNDGRVDSGGDQWTSDSFHTRDQVRQAAVDHMQFLRALRECGSGTMGADVDGDGEDEVACDWDGNGVPDIGGTGVDYYLAGGSLGGIITAVTAPVEPNFTASIPIVAGGGLMDIGTRSNLGGAVEAVMGRLTSPYILGFPGEDGSLQVVQYINTGFTDMESVPIATLDSIPGEGRVLVENLTNGEVREGWIPADGTFRVSFPADALDAAEKRLAAGIPETGPVEGEVYSIAGNDGLGDTVRITIWDADGDEVAVLETFEDEQVFEAVTLRAGSPLVAVSSGLGHIRGTPSLRRLVGSLALVTEPGDPIAYAPHVLHEPFEELFDAPLNMMQINNIGDDVVMINSGIALARAIGFLERHEIDPRYGMTVDNWLIDRRVVQGLEEYGPYLGADDEPCLFDPDDYDDGLDETGAPSDAPLRVAFSTESGVSALRLTYPDPEGSHGVPDPNPDAPFDWTTFIFNQAVYYLYTGGQDISSDHCLARNDCYHLRPVPEED